MTAMSKAKITRWAYSLPLFAVIVTSLLLVYAPTQDEAFYRANPGSRGYMAIHCAPAWTLAALINGPAFLLGSVVRLPLREPFDGLGRLIAVAAFWFCVGVVLDRRNRGTATPLITATSLNLVVQLSLLGISALLLVVFVGFCIDMLSWNFTHLRDSLRLFGLRSPVFVATGTTIWLIVSTVYFGRQTALAMRFRERRHVS